MLSGQCNRQTRGKCLMSATGAVAAKEDAFFSATLGEADPEIADVIAKELGRQRDEIELIASENIVSRAVLRGAGLRSDQQIRRRLSGPALLRRLPLRRHGREHRDRAREEAVRLQLRERAAQFRQPDEPGGVPGADEPGRHLHGARSRGRRTPDARLAGQHVGQVVQGGALRRAARRPPDRHGRRGAHRARGEAEDHHRGRRRPIRASGTSSAFARSPTRSARS